MDNLIIVPIVMGFFLLCFLIGKWIPLLIKRDYKSYTVYKEDDIDICGGITSSRWYIKYKASLLGIKFMITFRKREGNRRQYFTSEKELISSYKYHTTTEKTTVVNISICENENN